MAIECDLAVLGAGPGGYPAAIRAVQLGASVVCIEEGPVGGTCLNVGCIPTKAMVQSAHGYHEARERLAPLGIKVDNVTLDFPQVQLNRQGIVDGVVKGLGRSHEGRRHPGHQGPGPLHGPEHAAGRGR